MRREGAWATVFPVCGCQGIAGGGQEAPGAGHLKGELCGQQGRLVRGQLASSVRGRWNSAGTSGREQRKYWGAVPKGHRGGGKARGVPGPCCVTSQLHSLNQQPWRSAGGISLWGSEGQLSKCMGVGRGGVLPLGPASANNLISSLSLYLSLSLTLSFLSFFFLFCLVFLHLYSPLAWFSKVQLG